MNSIASLVLFCMLVFVTGLHLGHTRWRDTGYDLWIFCALVVLCFTAAGVAFA